MATTHANLKSELDKSIALLQSLRDEVRAQLHLGRLDAQQEWNDLEPRLESALTQAAREVSEASRQALVQAIGALQELRDTKKA